MAALDPGIKCGHDTEGRSEQPSAVRHSILDVCHSRKRLQAFSISRIPKHHSKLTLDLGVVDAFVVLVKAAPHRREIGILEGNFRGRRRADEFSRITQDILRGRRLIVRNIIDARGPAAPLAPDGGDYGLRISST